MSRPPPRIHLRKTAQIRQHGRIHAILKQFTAKLGPMSDNTIRFDRRETVDRPIPRVIEGSQGLTVTRIGKSFRRRPVVRSVSLTLKRGEVVGLLGPNGAGKTTCFYLITGLLKPDSGTIELDGHEIT